MDLSSDEMRMFLEEAQEQVQLLDEGIVRLEKEPDDGDLLNAIFRAAHTLKGSSSMIGFDAMAQLTHRMEDVLDRVRKQALRVTPEMVDSLLLGLDGLKGLCLVLAEPGMPEPDVSSIVTALEGILEGSLDASADVQATATVEALVVSPAGREKAAEAASRGLSVHKVTAKVSSADWASVRCYQALTELGTLGEVIESLPTLEAVEKGEAGDSLDAVVATERSEAEILAALAAVPDLVDVLVSVWEPPEEAAEVASAPEGDGARLDALQTVRIDVATLDGLMNMVGELVIDRTRLTQISRQLSASARDNEMVNNLTMTASHLAKVVDELNQKMMQARMLPVGLLFSKFPRMVRDLSRSLGKDIDLVIDGAETEIDRSVIDKIKDPIVHMLRNSVDHGIEKAEDRLQAGKPKVATISLSAHQEQGHIFITISDDGRGIDSQRVREVAVSRGLLSKEVADRLSDVEAIDLIFEAGFSTARSTTEVSGRGVGMDVVQRSITELGGAISTSTEVGKGTTFVLRLPLTLATFPGLLVSSGGSAFAIPTSFVQETLLMDEAMTRTVMGSEVLSLRGKALPIVRLDSRTLVGREIGASEGPRFVVVLRSDNKLLGLLVDRLLEQQEVVVKPIGRLASGVRGISGASILGDGRVALILDITSLLRTSSFGVSVPGETERNAA